MNISPNIAIHQYHRSNDELETCAQSVMLHASENAWRPPCRRKDSLDEKEQLKRCVQGVLNKLTFQKFKILLVQIENLQFNNLEDLNLVINLIFENAICEPQFSILYANLCKEVNLIHLSITNSIGNQENFHRQLITKCLQEFEKWCIEYKKETNIVDNAVKIGNTEKKKLQPLFDEDKRKIKCRQIGIVKFIGELFNFCIITNYIISECIQKLMFLESEQSLELVCQLLKTVGKMLDKNQIDASARNCDGNSMDVYFTQIQTIVDKNLISTRIRFMLQDIIELRKNNWIPRRRENIPKTIDEIHREIELEISENASPFECRSSKYQRG